MQYCSEAPVATISGHWPRPALPWDIAGPLPQATDLGVIKKQVKAITRYCLFVGNAQQMLVEFPASCVQVT